MEEAIISSNGEEDVGIGGAESHAQLDVDFDGDKNFRENTRDLLRKCFHEIHDCGRTMVTFKDEEPNSP